MSAGRGTACATWSAFFALVASGAAFTGCEAVPTLTFAADSEADGSGDGAGGADGHAADAGVCAEGVPPDGASVCCDPIPCEGDCSGKCPDCVAACRSGEICCAKTNNVVCHALSAGCH